MASKRGLRQGVMSTESFVTRREAAELLRHVMREHIAIYHAPPVQPPARRPWWRRWWGKSR